MDASALVDLLLGGPLGAAVRERVAGQALHAPAHVDAEVLSAVGRLHRAGHLGAESVDVMLSGLCAAPIRRHLLPDLLAAAWSRRHRLRLADALYVELAASLGLTMITTDHRLEPVPEAEVVVL